MKLCKKCGAYQNDTRFVCLDCNEMLGDSLSSDEATQIEGELRAKIQKKLNEDDPLAVNKTDRIIGNMSLFGIAVSIFMALFWRLLMYNVFNEGFYLALGALVLFIISALYALAFRTVWSWHVLMIRIHARIGDDTEPSCLSLIERKITIIFCFTVALVMLAFAIGYAISYTA